MRDAILGAALLGGAGVLGVACGGNSDDSCPSGNICIPADGSADGMGADQQLADVRRDANGNGDSGDGGMTTDGSNQGESAGCDLSQVPSQNDCVLQDGNGLFVARPPYGNDSTGDGTIEAPYATLTTAVTSLAGPSTTHRIYVCNGSYSDQVTVSSAVAIFGGVTCDEADAGSESGDGGSRKWTYTAGTRAVVSGTSADFVLKIDSAMTNPIDIEDMEFDGAGGASPGQSSIAVFVNASARVSMTRVKLEGGIGGTGSPGGSGGPGTTPVGANGENATDDNGAGRAICTCGSQLTVGGSGGTDEQVSSNQGGSGGPGQANGSSTPYAPSPSSSDTGAGGNGAITSPLTACANGFPGAEPPEETGSTVGAAAYALSSSGFVSTGNGGMGVTGDIGQGGGGGGGGAVLITDLIGGGGGGACGGCGGVGGTGGAGGGSSIALAVVDSNVTLLTCIVQGGTGGPGGPGGPGGSGGPGGLGGIGAVGGCGGGGGGQGGLGGPGAGGGGGASLGIAETATTSTVTLVSTTPTAGTPGTGGLDGDGKTTYRGATGLAASQQSF
jgi:hypothetical protein